MDWNALIKDLNEEEKIIRNLNEDVSEDISENNENDNPEKEKQVKADLRKILIKSVKTMKKFAIKLNNLVSKIEKAQLKLKNKIVNETIDEDINEIGRLVKGITAMAVSMENSIKQYVKIKEDKSDNIELNSIIDKIIGTMFGSARIIGTDKQRIAALQQSKPMTPKLKEYLDELGGGIRKSAKDIIGSVERFCIAAEQFIDLVVKDEAAAQKLKNLLEVIVDKKVNPPNQ